MPRVRGPRHRRDHRSGRGRLLAGGRVLAAMATILALALTGTGWAGYRSLAGGIITSQALAGGPGSTGGEQNILIIGLDSRLDQHGNPLPQDIYDALHAGDESVGGYNANVLILLHLPGDDGPVTAISIPRDDYVNLPGCPSGVCKGKIKQAYGLAYQQAMEDMAADTSSESDDVVANEQAAREAGRKAEINTVRALLGVPIDHFIEVTLGAFFQIAAVVQPITVCLNNDTADDYSGADFRQGVQQIDAAQAMAFVRQRRDLNDELFTDLDRTRRQQAFIVSLLSALRHDGALSSPSALRNLLRVAQQNVAVDAGFDLARFVDNDSALTGRPISLYTLPISEFGQDPAGEDVNIIDVASIRSIVSNLFATGSPLPTSTPAPAPSPPVPAVLNVVNASSHDGLASAVEETFTTRGFTAGEVSTADSLADASTIEFGTGSEEAATMLAEQLQLTATASDVIAAGTVQLTIGADFPADDYRSSDGSEFLAAPSSSDSPTAAPVDMVDATATGTQAPAPTDLTKMTGADTPCVR